MRNPVAKSLRSPHLRQRIVRDRTKYARKPKHAKKALLAAMLVVLGGCANTLETNPVLDELIAYVNNRIQNK